MVNLKKKLTHFCHVLPHHLNWNLMVLTKLSVSLKTWGLQVHVINQVTCILTFSRSFHHLLYYWICFDQIQSLIVDHEAHLMA